jgi:hypothetical protein
MIKELQALAHKLNEAHTLLDQVCAQMTLAQMISPRAVGEWSAKDVLAHLVTNTDLMTTLAECIVTGQNPSLPADFDNDRFNAEQVAALKDVPAAELRKRFDTTHQDVMDFLGQVAPEQLSICGRHPLQGELALKEFLVAVYAHETTHGRELWEYLHKTQ